MFVFVFCLVFFCCCFFRLRSIDIEFMKRLGRIVSIVPVIAKADALTIEERQEFKERVNNFHIHHSGCYSGSRANSASLFSCCAPTWNFFWTVHTLTLSQIRQDLAANGICVYPQKEYDEDPQERIVNDRIRVTTTLPSLPILFYVINVDYEKYISHESLSMFYFVRVENHDRRQEKHLKCFI